MGVPGRAMRLWRHAAIEGLARGPVSLASTLNPFPASPIVMLEKSFHTRSLICNNQFNPCVLAANP
jgi:hypothetical protein